MKKMISLALGLGLLAGAFAAQAQAPRASPADKVSVTMNGKAVTIDYSRPYLKGRTVGNEVAPFGKVWRTGANEATRLETAGDLMLGSLHVPAGTYSIYTIPGEGEWTLIVNKTAKQWGTVYDEKMDLGRAKMKVGKTAAPVEQLTIALEAKGAAGTLKISWGGVEASIAVMAH